MREYIKDQVLNYATLTDLTYHLRLMTHIKQNPASSTAALKSNNPFEMRLNQNSAMEERKEDPELADNSQGMTTPHGHHAKDDLDQTPASSDRPSLNNKKGQGAVSNY